jgi:hypothetical protein
MNQFKSISQAKKATKLSYLGGVNTSAKIEKNAKLNVLTYIIYLAPSNMSGYNVCPMASEYCISLCLNESGHNSMAKEGELSTIDIARIAKTKLYYENRPYFSAWTIAEIRSYKEKANKLGMGFSVRINGTSDLSPETITQDGKNVLEIFPDVQFYDYTKIPKRLALTKIYPNYHLTFSFSGTNMVDCMNALSDGYNVAMVFEKELPRTFAGYTVINADESDLRYLDGSGVICGLKFKRVRGKKDISKSPFVIKRDSTFCEW